MDNSELRGLLAKVPAGKWTAEYDNADHSGGGCWYELQVNGDNPLWYPYNAPAGVAEQAEATAMLLAAAVNALPRLLADSDELASLRARVAQEQAWPASHTTFAFGDHVRKKRGSRWQGRVVGWYSTTLTSEGYAIESDTEHGSVQIYPASALERSTEDSSDPKETPQ